MVRNPRAAAAWRLARELAPLDERRTGPSTPLRASPSTPLKASQSSRRRSPARTPWPAGNGRDAGLVVAAAWQLQPWRSDPPEYRSADPRSITSLLPAGDRLSREQPVLRWTALDGARYRVRVLTPELDLLDEAEDLAAPEYRLPPDVLRRIPAGGRMLWQVEARVPGIAAVVSPTFTVQLE